MKTTETFHGGLPCSDLEEKAPCGKPRAVLLNPLQREGAVLVHQNWSSIFSVPAGFGEGRDLVFGFP